MKIITAGSILSKKLGNQLLTVHLQPQSGSCFNNEIKFVEEPSNLSSHYDITYPIKHVTPCSFLKNN
ncbi:MAG: hypothetical protein WC595_02775 [Candidatus Nanoarchaeia archaeon]